MWLHIFLVLVGRNVHSVLRTASLFIDDAEPGLLLSCVGHCCAWQWRLGRHFELRSGRKLFAECIVGHYLQVRVRNEDLVIILRINFLRAKRRLLVRLLAHHRLATHLLLHLDRHHVLGARVIVLLLLVLDLRQQLIRQFDEAELVILQLIKI